MISIKNKISAFMLVLSVSAIAGELEIQSTLQDYVPYIQAINSSEILHPVSVGNDTNSCDFHTIQDAIDSGADLVRIVDTGNDYIENLLIVGNNVNLQGNFASCEDANNNVTSNVMAVIHGDVSSNVIVLQNDGVQTHTNKFSHVHLTGGRGSLGAGIQADGIDMLVLENVVISQNHANADGGGIYAHNTRLYVKNSVIEQNSAGVDGGGINSNVTVLLDGHTHIRNNFADNGAGLYGNFIIFSPVKISGNEAETNGGGILFSEGENYIIGKQVCESGHCFGVNNQSVCVVNNTSDEMGGGMYLLEGENNVDVFNAWLYDNKAGISGGALVKNSGTGELLMDSSHIQGNRANSGAVALVAGDAAPNPRSLVIQNSVVVDNGDLSDGYKDFNLFQLSGNAMMELNSNTFAENKVKNELVLSTSSQTEAVMLSNIFADDILFNSGDPGASFIFDCTLIKNNTGINMQPFIVVGEADFVNPAGGDFTLAPNSMAIDFCSQSSATLQDKVGYPRGVDVPSVVDRFGPYDLGAFEMSFGEIIFKNGFDVSLNKCIN